MTTKEVIQSMPQALKDKWVAALRSGTYPQTKSRCYRQFEFDNAPNGFCCLGVLMDVAGEPLDSIVNYALPPGRFANKHGIVGAYVSPAASGEIKASGGATNLNFVFCREGHWENASTINDDGASFAEIADLVEEQIVGTSPEGESP